MMTGGGRRCYKCETIKPLDDFHACRRDPLGRQKLCKMCFKAYGHANRDRIAEVERRAYARDPDYRREVNRKWRDRRMEALTCS
jgi:hypothetical protein